MRKRYQMPHGSEPGLNGMTQPPMPPRRRRTDRERPRRGRVAAFFRGYLMAVGFVTTMYALVQLAVFLLVEAGKWMN